MRATAGHSKRRPDERSDIRRLSPACRWRSCGLQRATAGVARMSEAISGDLSPRMSLMLMRATVGYSRCWRSCGLRSLAPKHEFHELFQADLGSPDPSAKIFRFSINQNQWLHRVVSRSQEGRTRRHERGERDAVDAATSARRAMLLRTAKSCGSGAPTLALNWRRCLASRR
jgi:hypothetical protein